MARRLHEEFEKLMRDADKMLAESKKIREEASREFQNILDRRHAPVPGTGTQPERPQS